MPSIGNITKNIFSGYEKSRMLAKRFAAGVSILGTLLGGTVEKAYAYSSEIHKETGIAVGMLKESAEKLTKADVMRDAGKAFQYKGSEFKHFVDEVPFSIKIDPKSVDRIIQGINEVPAEVALHEIADLGSVGHVSRYTPWLEKQHGFMDNQLNASKLGKEKFDALRKSLKDVPAATGDFNQNLRQHIESGEILGNRYDLRKTVPPEDIAAARLKRSVALMKQYANLYPERFAAIKNAPLGDMTTWDISADYASGGYNKIVGHHSGWANKNTEAAIDSDFTAGKSWTQRKMMFDMVGVRSWEEFRKMPAEKMIANLRAFRNMSGGKMSFGYESGTMNAHMRYGVVKNRRTGEYLKHNYHMTIDKDLVELLHNQFGVSNETALKFLIGHEAMEAASFERWARGGAGKRTPKSRIQKRITAIDRAQGGTGFPTALQEGEDALHSFFGHYGRSNLEAVSERVEELYGFTHFDLGVLAEENRIRAALGIKHKRWQKKRVSNYTGWRHGKRTVGGVGDYIHSDLHSMNYSDLADFLGPKLSDPAYYDTSSAIENKIFNSVQEMQFRAGVLQNELRKTKSVLKNLSGVLEARPKQYRQLSGLGQALRSGLYKSQRAAKNLTKIRITKSKVMSGTKKAVGFLNEVVKGLL